MSGFEVEALKALPPCHPQLVEAIITQIKSQGLFDDFRKSCLSDIDTKPSYLNLKQRVEGYVNKFLSRQKWSSSLQKNQLRETLRKDINESGLLKTGLDHLVDQLLYAHAEKSIRPEVRAEIKKFLNLSDAPDRPPSVAVCVTNYSVAPPNYGPPAMPPLPPVPPPPDVTGAMIDTFGGLKPPEPPSPHGSEYSVDMSDSSMVGRDEAPPAIPNRVTAEKHERVDEREVLSSSPMDIEENFYDEHASKKDDESECQALVQCLSPEIFEEVSEGGSLGGTPVRDEEASLEKEAKVDEARTNFAGLFKDSRSVADESCNETEVIVDEESMVFGVLEECVKTADSAKIDSERATPTVDDDPHSSQDADLDLGNVTPILDEVPDDDHEDIDMQISTDEETQCVDEVQLPSSEVRTEDKNSGNASKSVECSPQMGDQDQISLVEKASHESDDTGLSDTQPPLQIDTEDTELTVIEKNQPEDSQEAGDATKAPSKATEGEDVFCESQQEPLGSTTKSSRKNTESEERARWISEKAYNENERSHSENVESEKHDSNSCNGEQRSCVTDEMVKLATTSEQGSSNHARESKYRERKSSSHQKSSSRSENGRDRHREHRSSGHHGTSFSSSSSSSRSKKISKEHDQRSRDKVYDKRDDRRDKDRTRRKERDDRDRDRGQRDGKHRSSSHSHSRHSRHHQDKRRDDERKTQCSTASSSNKSSQGKSGESSSKSDVRKSTSAAAGKRNEDASLSQPKDQTEVNKEFAELAEDHLSPAAKPLTNLSEDESAISAAAVTVTSPETPGVASPVASTSLRRTPEDNRDSELEVPLKKRKRKASKQQDSIVDQDFIAQGSNDPRKENQCGKGRRRSSAASVTSQQSVEAIDQPESPVPSKFGRQRKINPKYEDDGTLSALLFGKN